MKRKLPVRVTWKDKSVVYNSVEECACDLEISCPTVYNYLYGTTKTPFGMRFEKLSKYERLLKEALEYAEDERGETEQAAD